MANNKTLRTPIIKPRQQGGTFYTFGSAMEDIGLNVNETFNRVEMSHYVLLDIPKFCKSVPTGSTDPDYEYSLVLNNQLPYDSQSKYPNRGDYMFAESFQNYCLNMETVVRNDGNYNYASNKTVSERVFWKWLFKKYNKTNFDSSTGESNNTYYFEHDKPILKGFGSISAGSQRTDDSGIYNETFVQIPSSYGPMRVLFKKSIDENYLSGKDYNATTPPNIENIDASTEISDGVITSTGISPVAEYDTDTKYTVSAEGNDSYEVVFDINELRNYYGDQSLTYDDIAMGKVNDVFGTPYNTTEYSFNAILVYYSIYNSDKTKRLATNAYGLYILDNSIEYSVLSDDILNDGWKEVPNVHPSNNTYNNNTTYKSGDTVDVDHRQFVATRTISGVPPIRSYGNEYQLFYFPSLLKKKSTKKENGSSYSFRINVKPTTAYSGDIHVTDNSTEAFSMSEDFNDVVRNLAGAINILKGNAKTLLKIVQDNRDIKQMAADAIERVDNVESDVISLKNVNFPYTSDNIVENGTNLDKQVAQRIVNCINVNYSDDGNLTMFIDKSSLDEGSIERKIADKMTRTIDDRSYVDALSMLMLIVSISKN